MCSVLRLSSIAAHRSRSESAAIWALLYGLSGVVYQLIVKVKLDYLWPNILLASLGVSFTEVTEESKWRGVICPLSLLWACAKYRVHSLDPGQDILKNHIYLASRNVSQIWYSPCFGILSNHFLYKTTCTLAWGNT